MFQKLEIGSMQLQDMPRQRLWEQLSLLSFPRKAQLLKHYHHRTQLLRRQWMGKNLRSRLAGEAAKLVEPLQLFRGLQANRN
jgi:hypothetical protein